MNARMRLGAVVAAAAMVAAMPLASYADDPGSGSEEPQEAPTHSVICYTHHGNPYVHVCVP